MSKVPRRSWGSSSGLLKSNRTNPGSFAHFVSSCDHGAAERGHSHQAGLEEPVPRPVEERTPPGSGKPRAPPRPPSPPPRRSFEESGIQGRARRNVCVARCLWREPGGFVGGGGCTRWVLRARDRDVSRCSRRPQEEAMPLVVGGEHDSRPHPSELREHSLPARASPGGQAEPPREKKNPTDWCRRTLNPSGTAKDDAAAVASSKHTRGEACVGILPSSAASPSPPPTSPNVSHDARPCRTASRAYIEDLGPGPQAFVQREVDTRRREEGCPTRAELFDLSCKGIRDAVAADIR